MNKPMLSFVIPCYRSEHTIGAVVKELTDTLSTRSEYEYEIVLVNDGSRTTRRARWKRCRGRCPGWCLWI